MHNPNSANGAPPVRPASALDLPSREPSDVRPESALDHGHAAYYDPTLGWPEPHPEEDPTPDADDPAGFPPLQIVVEVGPHRVPYFGRLVGVIGADGRYGGGFWDLVTRDGRRVLLTDHGPREAGHCTCREFAQHWDCRHLHAMAAAGHVTFAPWYTPSDERGSW